MGYFSCSMSLGPHLVALLRCRGTAQGQLILESLDDIPLYSAEKASAALQRCAMRCNVLCSVVLGRQGKCRVSPII